MDTQVDGRIILNPESEYHNLYEWSLQEATENGERGDNYIPWPWSLYFTATELSVHENVGANEAGSGAPDSPMIPLVERRIFAKLIPGDIRTDSNRHTTTYSMFRTSRAVAAFDLSIQPRVSPDDKRAGVVWGTVAYTTEIDFEDLETPDTVVFYLYVDLDVFERLERKIAASQVDRAVLRVGGVEGFYAEWSPEISTSFVKILTKGAEHAVDVPPGCEIDPPRLGKIGEIHLYLSKTAKLVVDGNP